MSFLLQNICSVQNQRGTFVGLKRKKGELPQIIFPHGYRLPSIDSNRTEQTEANYRKCVLDLVSVLEQTRKKQQGVMPVEAGDVLSQPLWAYAYLVQRFLDTRRFCSERTETYKEGGCGSISWERTFKAVKPIYTVKGRPYYPRMVMRSRAVRPVCVLTRLHRYCVWKSFHQLGWLFGSFMPPKEKLTCKERRMGIQYLHRLRARNHNDSLNLLYRAMLDVLAGESAPTTADEDEISYGTQNFEHSWEKMIEGVFGNEDRQRYYPRVEWTRLSRSVADKAATVPLKPDSIMRFQEKIFILDAKYYQADCEMPGASDVGKQYLYGLWADKLQSKQPSRAAIYNAFLLPGSELKEMGYYRFSWESDGAAPASYGVIVALSLDTRMIMEQFLYKRQSKWEVQRAVAECIENVLSGL